MPITMIPAGAWSMKPPGPGGHRAMPVHGADPFCVLLEEQPHSYTATHCHSEPEIFCVLDGRMLFNGKWCETGSVLHVPAHEDYWYATSDQHCVIALIRPAVRGAKIDAVEAMAAQ